MDGNGVDGNAFISSRAFSSARGTFCFLPGLGFLTRFTSISFHCFTRKLRRRGGYRAGSQKSCCSRPETLPPSRALATTTSASLNFIELQHRTLSGNVCLSYWQCFFSSLGGNSSACKFCLIFPSIGVKTFIDCQVLTQILIRPSNALALSTTCAPSVKM